jgi:hypothetical protein
VLRQLHLRVEFQVRTQYVSKYGMIWLCQ